MSYSVREGLHDAQAEVEFLMELQRRYPDAIYDQTIPGWTCHRVEIST